MNRSVVIFIGLFLFAACSKNHTNKVLEQEEINPAPYDTVAVDSFSAGAIPAEVARNIRMTSQKYRDSLTKIKLEAAEEQKKKEELAKMQKIAQDAIDKEKSKEQKAETKKETPALIPAPTTTPPVSNTPEPTKTPD